MPRYVVDVTRCAACGGDHIGLEITEISKSAEGCTHSVFCPDTGRRLLIRVVKPRKLNPVLASAGGFIVGGAIGYSLAGWPGLLGVGLVYAVYLIAWGGK